MVLSPTVRAQSISRPRHVVSNSLGNDDSSLYGGMEDLKKAFMDNSAEELLLHLT